jgi:hypothetical protein
MKHFKISDALKNLKNKDLEFANFDFLQFLTKTEVIKKCFFSKNVAQCDQ